METPNFIKEHADKILANVNRGAIRARKFKIVVDMINGSAAVMDPYLFESLGVELVAINNTPDGKFAHKPEPLKENLTELSETVKKENADLGFAHDPDADRLVIVNELGEVIFEEYSLTLAVENILSKNLGRNIAINLSTSRMNVDVAEKYGGRAFFTKIGEGNVVEGMLEHNAIIGGEGSGGIIYPAINTARDSFVGLALVLELLAEREQTVSECVASLPKYFMKKEKWPVGASLEDMYSKLKSRFNDAKVEEQDGLRLDFVDHSWIQVRPSNTEPIVRLYGEAKTKDQIEALFDQAKLTLNPH